MLCTVPCQHSLMIFFFSFLVADLGVLQLWLSTSVQQRNHERMIHALKETVERKLINIQTLWLTSCHQSIHWGQSMTNIKRIFWLKYLVMKMTYRLAQEARRGWWNPQNYRLWSLICLQKYWWRSSHCLAQKTYADVPRCALPGLTGPGMACSGMRCTQSGGLSMETGDLVGNKMKSVAVMMWFMTAVHHWMEGMNKAVSRVPRYTEQCLGLLLYCAKQCLWLLLYKAVFTCSAVIIHLPQ